MSDMRFVLFTITNTTFLGRCGVLFEGRVKLEYLSNSISIHYLSEMILVRLMCLANFKFF